MLFKTSAFSWLLSPRPPPGGQRTSEAQGKQQKRAPVCSQGSLSPPRGAVTPRGRRHAFPPALGEKNLGKAAQEQGRGSWPDGRCEARGPTAARSICSAGRSCLGGPAVTHAPQTCGACARGHWEQHRVPCPGSPAVGPWPAALAAPRSSSVPLPGRWLQPAPLRSGPAGQLRPLQGGTRNPGSQRLSAGWGGRGGRGGRA